MRTLALALLLATPVAAETISEEIARAGLAPTEARLAALASPSNEDLFALAGLHFLGGVEQALQLRWKTGVKADWSELPILRLPIPENPNAIPFQAADFTALIRNLDADMDASREALTRLGDKPFALPIRVADLWFDINANGTRDPGESLAEVTGMALGGGRGMGVRSKTPSSPSTPPTPPGCPPTPISCPASPPPRSPTTPNPRSSASSTVRRRSTPSGARRRRTTRWT
jgi:hypothetical protein